MSDVNFIRDYLAVCGFSAIRTPEEFQRLHIDAHLQLVPGYDTWISDFVEVKQIFYDDCKPLPRQLISDAFNWFFEKREKGHKILVSCAAGESRSVAMAIGFLLFDENINVTTVNFLDVASEVCRIISGAYPHPEPLISIANHWGKWLSFTGLRTFYDQIERQPPFPWEDADLRKALANQEERRGKVDEVKFTK